MTALPAFIFPENIWPVALTGTEFIPILAGSVYPTVVTLNTITSFFGGAFLPLTGGSVSGNTTFGVGSGGAGTGLTVNNKAQALQFTTGSNAFTPSASALIPLIFSGATVTGSVTGAGAWNTFAIASDTADFRAAADNTGKILNIQYNIGAGAQGARAGVWAQMNPVGLTSAMEILPFSANIAVNSNAGGSFLQPFSSSVNIQASALNVGNTLNEADYTVSANVVGIKGAWLFALGTGDVFQGISADAALFFSNANISGVSAGMASAMALGTTNEGFPLGTNGAVIRIYPQTANQGSGQNAQFIAPIAKAGIDLQYLNTSLQTGFAYRAPGFWVDGTGQVAAQGFLLGRSGTSYTLDVPSTFAVASIVPNVPGVPVVSANSSRANYYPGDVVNGTGSPPGQYQITQGQVVSAAVTSGGSGGTNGAQVVTISGGTGVAATVNVTVTGGVITAVNSIATAGTYNTYPANLNAAPVTGASLTGATLAIGMGVKTLTVLVPDVFVTNVTAITPVGGSGAGLTLTATNQTRAGLSIMPTAGGLLGFYGTAPLAKQTGVAVTAAGIHAACVALGIFSP